MDDLPFDLSKKKKKKKKPVDFDELESADNESKPASSEVVEKPKEKEEEAEDVTADFDGDFSNLKKKKKKKVPFDLSEMDKNLAEANEKADSEQPAEVDGGEDIDFDFSMTKKKRKGKNKVQFTEGEQPAEQTSAEGGEAPVLKEKSIWLNHERDPTYDDLLSRVFEIMREHNPAMLTGEKKKLVMKPPQVSRAGAKKTAFSNFSEICKMLHRQPKHLLAFLLAELGTSGSVDGSNSLIIKGRFQQKQIESVLRSYIKEYVTCHTCKSPETILQRDTRLYFLQCELCGSRCSVASIRSGFQAVTGKRAALRAKKG